MPLPGKSYKRYYEHSIVIIFKTNNITAHAAGTYNNKLRAYKRFSELKYNIQCHKLTRATGVCRAIL